MWQIYEPVQPEAPIAWEAIALGAMCLRNGAAIGSAGRKCGQADFAKLRTAHSTYTNVRWTPKLAWSFLKNISYWVGYFSQWSREQRRDFVLWKIRSLKKRINRMFKHVNTVKEQMDVEDIVDLSTQPPGQRLLWEQHVRALMKHHPKPYGGSVVLFRTRGHQFLCSFDDQYGWGDLARSGVLVKIVPGAHESILDEPYVQTVADELKQVLNSGAAKKSRWLSMNFFVFLFRTARGLTVFTVLTALLSGACNAGLIALVNYALTHTSASVTTLAWSFAALGVGKLATNALSQVMLTRFCQDSIARLRKELVEKILSVPLRRVEEIGAARLTVALTEDVLNITQALLGIPNFALNLAVLIGGAVYLGWLSWKVSLVLFCFILTGVIGYRWMIIRGFGYLAQAREEEDRLFSHFRALTDGIKELKLHRSRRGRFLTDNIQATMDVFSRHNVAAEIRFIIAHCWSHFLYFAIIASFFLLYRRSNRSLLKP